MFRFLLFDHLNLYFLGKDLISVMILLPLGTLTVILPNIIAIIAAVKVRIAFMFYYVINFVFFYFRGLSYVFTYLLLMLVVR